jgi:hypothetical protein
VIGGSWEASLCDKGVLYESLVFDCVVGREGEVLGVSSRDTSRLSFGMGKDSPLVGPAMDTNFMVVLGQSTTDGSNGSGLATPFKLDGVKGHLSRSPWAPHRSLPPKIFYEPYTLPFLGWHNKGFVGHNFDLFELSSFPLEVKPT